MILPADGRSALIAVVVYDVPFCLISSCPQRLLTWYPCCVPTSQGLHCLFPCLYYRPCAAQAIGSVPVSLSLLQGLRCPGDWFSVCFLVSITGPALPRRLVQCLFPCVYYRPCAAQVIGTVMTGLRAFSFRGAPAATDAAAARGVRA